MHCDTWKVRAASLVHNWKSESSSIFDEIVVANNITVSQLVWLPKIVYDVSASKDHIHGEKEGEMPPLTWTKPPIKFLLQH